MLIWSVRQGAGSSGVIQSWFLNLFVVCDVCCTYYQSWHFVWFYFSFLFIQFLHAKLCFQCESCWVFFWCPEPQILFFLASGKLSFWKTLWTSCLVCFLFMLMSSVDSANFTCMSVFMQEMLANVLFLFSRAAKGTVIELLTKKCDRENLREVLDQLG